MIIHSISSDIILGTEIWLSDDINDTDLALPSSFVIFRKNRTVSRGSGVFIAVYRLPDCRPDFTDLFNEALELVTNRFPDCLLIIGGDFNYPAIDWPTITVSSQSKQA